MNRPDTGTQRNMIVQMAASIMAAKVEYMRCVADQYRDKLETELANKWMADAKEIEQAIAVMDKGDGCWS